ncbi:MAG: PAS domain S-box protein [Acidobacteria bacterium]|nr:PAS domain S-box protein [Acidobacteriota bacterium]
MRRKREKSLTRQLLLMMGFRAVIVTTLLGTAIGVQLLHQEEIQPYNPLYYVVGLVYLLTIIYATLFNFIKNKKAFAYFQIMVDLLFITFLVEVTWSSQSFFSLLYFISIIAAAIILLRRGALIVATASTICYSLLLYLIYQKAVPLPYSAIIPPTKSLFLNGFVHAFGFYTIALLSSYLTESLRRSNIELKIRAEQLKDLENFNQNIIECMSSGLITTTLSGRILSLNRAAKEITGFAPAEAIGKHISTVLDIDEKKLSSISHFLKKKKFYRYERSYRAKDGTEKYIGGSITFLRSKGGKPNGYIFIFQDLSELKKLEEEMKQKEKLAAIGEMATGIAHEIRNPLAAMSGSIQLLMKDYLISSRGGELMEIILRESERLNRILKNFLDYAKPLPFHPMEVDLTALLEETIALLKNSRELNEKHQILFDNNQRMAYYCDPNQMKQVFWNLARNALKAMPDGGRLIIKMKKKGDEGLILSFKDEGVGMSEEERKDLFQPFKGSFEEGTGLGMAIVYRIVQNHRGRIDVQSRKGEGTEVTISLPPIMKREKRERIRLFQDEMK